MVNAANPVATLDPTASPSLQQAVTDYFDSIASFWRSVYDDPTVYGHIHKQRWQVVLGWIDDLRLSGCESVLEVGCGAGLITVALAERGFQVHATDVSSRMLQLASDAVWRTGLGCRVSLSTADVQALQFQSDSFSLVVALGVIPWLPSPEIGLREMVRVLKPGGYLLLNCDNRWRLHHLLDPVYMPLFPSLRKFSLKLLRDWGMLAPAMGAPIATHSQDQFDRMLAAHGMEKLRSMMLGFGPFSFLSKSVFSERKGIEIHDKLQRLADRKLPVLRSTGSQYLILARKRPTL